jgi:hypothetical protein
MKGAVSYEQLGVISGYKGIFKIWKVPRKIMTWISLLLMKKKHWYNFSAHSWQNRSEKGRSKKFPPLHKKIVTKKKKKKKQRNKNRRSSTKIDNNRRPLRFPMSILSGGIRQRKGNKWPTLTRWNGCTFLYSSCPGKCT